MKNRNLCHDFRYGKIMYNQLDKFVGKSLKLYGEYSQGEATAFEQMIFPGDCVVEVGANIGAHTVHLAQIVGDAGVVWAFEPQRLVFQLLAGNIAINGLTNVYCRQNCVSNQPGIIKVPVLDTTKVQNWGGLSMLNNPEGEPVEAITLDSLNLPRCNFLKIDVEGMELQVLEGANRLIDRCQPIIYTEISNIRKNNQSVFSFLWKKGYHIYEHTPPLYNPDNYFGNPEDVFLIDGKHVVSYNAICLPESSRITLDVLPRQPRMICGNHNLNLRRNHLEQKSPHPFRSEPHGIYAHRKPAHGALRLSLRQGGKGNFHPAH